MLFQRLETCCCLSTAHSRALNHCSGCHCSVFLNPNLISASSSTFAKTCKRPREYSLQPSTQWTACRRNRDFTYVPINTLLGMRECKTLTLAKGILQCHPLNSMQSEGWPWSLSTSAFCLLDIPAAVSVPSLFWLLLNHIFSNASLNIMPSLNCNSPLNSVEIKLISKIYVLKHSI